jgi:hypothetical protein
MNNNIMRLGGILLIITMVLFPVTVVSITSLDSHNQVTSQDRCRARWLEDAKLIASDAGFWDAFGNTVSLHGNYAFIGSPNDETHTGAVYVFKHTDDSWIQDVKLTASDAAPYSWFGSSVSASGNSVLIGTPSNNDFIGSAYVFTREGTSWVEESRLIPSDGEPNDSFGQSVSLFKDYALIGAPYENNQNGSVYVFKREDTTWLEVDKLSVDTTNNTFGETFGHAVSLYGEYALIGAPLDEYSIGSAYIFKHTGADWVEVEKLMPSDGVTYDWFGTSVSLYGEYALIGAHNNGYGAAYVFTRSNTSWIEETKLLAGDGTEGDWLGYSVSLYKNYALLGAPFKDDGEGACYVFKRLGTQWRKDGKLNASDGLPWINFGYSVSISGEYALVGAPDAYWGVGWAYVFHRIPSPSLCAHPCE